MTLHTGTGVRPGVAIAAAARLRVEHGVVSFAPERLRRIAARLRAFGAESPEPEQIVLIAESLPAGFTAATAGLEVVGLAVGSDAPLIPPPGCPAVIGLGDDFFESVREEEIVIVDGSRGRVHTSPDAVTLARCQSPAVRARRIFLDDSHLPARTASEGRTVAVLAPIRSREDADAAMASGADGVCLAAGDDFLPSASAQADLLGALMHVLGGLPLLLHVPPDSLSLVALARASALGPLHLTVDGAAARGRVMAGLSGAEAMLEDDDLPFGTPQFEIILSGAGDADLPDDLDAYAGIFVAEPLGEARMERLLPLAARARRARRPLLLTLSGDWPTELPHALTLGATRLLVPPAAVPDVKDSVRAW